MRCVSFAALALVCLVLGDYLVTGQASTFPLGHPSNPAFSCWEIRSNSSADQPPESGYYWLERRGPPYYSAGRYQAYCDMSTEDGGWTLVAKITDDYSWICPDKKGQFCADSPVHTPAEANLWHSAHTRLFIKPEFVSVGADSGVHLPLADVRRIFEGGLRSIRFSFYKGQDLRAPPDNDAVASFFQPRGLFKEAVDISLVKNRDYEFRVLRHSGNQKATSFRGKHICWLTSNTERNGYEGGLFMGTSDHIPGCHLDNANFEVQLKSHYTNGNVNNWYGPRHSFLKQNNLQVTHSAIMLWVR